MADALVIGQVAIPSLIALVVGAYVLWTLRPGA